MAKHNTAWNRHLMKVWNELKHKNKNAKFSDAMKLAKKSYNGGK